MTLFAQIDTGFPHDPKVVKAGHIAELVYLRCLLHCRERLTDGVIDRDLFARITDGIPKAFPAADRLVDVGLWETHPVGWAIPLDVWVKRNPLAADVEAKRVEDVRRKKEWREKKERDERGAAT